MSMNRFECEMLQHPRGQGTALSTFHFNRTLALKHVGSVWHEDGSLGSLRTQQDGNRAPRPHKLAVAELHLGFATKLGYEPPRGYTKDWTPRSQCVGEKGQWTVHNTQSSSRIAGRRRLPTAITSDTSQDELSRAPSSFALAEEQVERTVGPVQERVKQDLSLETVAARTTRVQQQVKSGEVVIRSLSKPMPLGQNTRHTRPPSSPPPPASRPIGNHSVGSAELTTAFPIRRKNTPDVSGRGGGSSRCASNSLKRSRKRGGGQGR